MKANIQYVGGIVLIMKQQGMKANFSALSRAFNVDRHKISEIYKKGEIPPQKPRNRKSKWDPYYDEIVHLMKKPGTTIKAVHEYLKDNYGEENIPGKYNSLKSYTNRKNIHPNDGKQEAHVLYENDKGEVLQCDFKENLKFELSTGEVIEFNVFSATLGYSREHVFIYTKTKTRDDFLRCIAKAFRKIGGITESVLTDNAAAVKNHSTGKVLPEVTQFFKDIDVKFKTCRIHTPETKGLVENSNKFVNWIQPYQGELDTEDELINLIENTITNNANKQINTGTGLPPLVLFDKEKEYLRPLPNKVLVDSDLTPHSRQKVGETLLIDYKGCKYSVPKEYINKSVDIYPEGNEIQIRCNGNLIATHNITQKDVNYSKEHYVDAMKDKYNGTDDEIEMQSLKSLSKLDRLRAEKREIRKEYKRNEKNDR